LITGDLLIDGGVIAAIATGRYRLGLRCPSGRRAPGMGGI
jgi:hypothetical protein